MFPACNPFSSGQMGLSYASLPQSSNFITGTSSLITHEFVGDFGVQKGFSTGARLNVGHTSVHQSANNIRHTTCCKVLEGG